MKKTLLLASVLSLVYTTYSQNFTPIATTGYTLDAVAENTTALATTGGAIDGSNYVLYSVAYGALYSVTSGLPNTGLISAGTRTYQLQSYTQPNLLYVTAGSSDTVFFTTPAAYAGLSLLAFSTEGDGNFTSVITFTDNTTQVNASLSLPDWFNNGNTVISGFDRVSRSIGTPANLSGQPKMFYVDIPVICANRSKDIQYIVIQNTSSNARNCVMAVSGTGAPSFSASSQPVTCPGGTNGSASITATGGIPPLTFTWNSTPVQNTPLAATLPVGTYSYQAQDNGGCVFSGTVAVSQSLVPEPPLTVSSNIYTICSGGTFTMGANGAATYSWTNGPNTSIYSPGTLTSLTPSVFVYNVSGHTTANCLRNGSISILVNPLPVITFTGSLPNLCVNNAPVNLNPLVQQTGGNFTGSGVIVSAFHPSITGIGTFNIVYSKTDANGCSNSATTSVQVFSLAAPQLSQPSALCANNSPISLTVSPTGGTFGGTGVSGGQFDPAIAGAGTHPIGYTITSGPCEAKATVNVVVNSVSMASLTGKTFFCTTHPVYIFNGLPSGGAISGPGLTGFTFDPKKGTVNNSNILTYTYTNIQGCKDTAALRVTVSACVGIDEQAQDHFRLQVYPNPSNGVFTLQAEKRTAVVIFNSAGQLVRNTILLDESNGFKATLNDLSQGIYFIRAEDDSDHISVRLIISE